MTPSSTDLHAQHERGWRIRIDRAERTLEQEGYSQHDVETALDSLSAAGFEGEDRDGLQLLTASDLAVVRAQLQDWTSRQQISDELERLLEPIPVYRDGDDTDEHIVSTEHPGRRVAYRYADAGGWTAIAHVDGQQVEAHDLPDRRRMAGQVMALVRSHLLEPVT